MTFAGLIPLTLSDWPGRPAAIAFTHGCDLRCRYCHNPDLVAGPPPARVPGEEVLALLARRRGFLEGLVVTGGEPTLHPGLAPFLAKVRALGVAVKLDTNGMHPESIAALHAARLLDHLAVDLKAGPADAAWLCGSAEQPVRARRCLALARAAGVPHEARTTVAAPLHTPAALAELSRWAEGAERWVLQRLRPDRQLDPSAGLRVPDAGLVTPLRARASLRGFGASEDRQPPVT